jgi:hypothetical protein
MWNFGFQIWADFRRRVDAGRRLPSGEASSKICPKREDQKSASSPKLGIVYHTPKEKGKKLYESGIFIECGRNTLFKK